MFRSIARVFTARGAWAVLLTTVLVIFANTSVFALVNALLLRPLPYPNSERLLSVGGRDDERAETTRVPGTVCRASLPKTELHSFGCYSRDVMQLDEGSGGPRVGVLRTTSTIFEVLQIRPAIGRAFSSEEETDAPDVAVLSDEMWRNRYEADPNVLGKLLRLDGRAFAIVGVMPGGVSFPDAGTDIWIPMNPDRRFSRDVKGNVSVAIPQVRLVTRLADGATRERVVGVFSRALSRDPSLVVVVSLRDALVGRLDQPLLALQAVVGLLLVMAAVNISTLHVARGIERDRALAVRLALGASRRRLICDFVLESGLVVCMGGLAGIALTWAMSRLVTGFMRQVSVDSSPATDATVVAAGVAISLALAIMSSVAPALYFARPNIASRLGGGMSERPMRARGLGALVAFQTALSFVIVVAATHFAGALFKIVTRDFGYERAGRVAVDVRLPPTEADSLQRLAVIDSFLEVARQGSPPRSISLASALPVQDRGQLFALDSGQASTGPVRINRKGAISVVLADPDYFDVLGIPRLFGRVFIQDDRASGPVVVLSSSAARQQYETEEAAVGKPFPLGIGNQTATVIGVVGDVAGDPLRPSNAATAYVPYFQFTAVGQSPPTMVTIVGRGAGFATAAVRTLPLRLANVAPNIELGAAASLDQRVYRALGPINFYAAVVGAFAVLSLVLATIGVFAVLARRVAARSKEMAIRMAVGADPRTMFRGVLLEGVTLAVGGIVMALPLAWMASRAAAASFLTTPPGLLWTFALAAAVLLGSSLLGCLSPALKAMRVDLGQLTRQE